MQPLENAFSNSHALTASVAAASRAEQSPEPDAHLEERFRQTDENRDQQAADEKIGRDHDDKACLAQSAEIDDGD